MKLNRLFPAAIVIITVCLTSCTTEDGLDGVKGDPGTIGDGATGINCWDTNSNGTNDEEEDTNQDGEFNALDCRGMDGADGANGVDGVDGENGTNGSNGENGVDGVGLEDMLRFGSIEVELQGIRPDNVAFANNESFRYTPVDGDDIDTYNSVVSNNQGNDIVYQFELRRFLSTPDEVYQIAFADISLSITKPEQLPFVFNQASIQINNYAVIGNDNKYFVLDDQFDNNGPGVTDFVLSDISFDTVTNNLQFSYSFTVDAANNDSNNELNISGNVDVFVLELIN
ncbi:collagen-like protein [Flagellimonas sp. CMM7]|uniref:collagen-like protein n=1 Tax=Flagellimonas sp. CMM7 TaxID=2654676 RepID=UPI0013D1C650|nr:collagen-like protein [Flagellimonas sp. CMM7]UII80817.1 hypothetical protein LV704_04730 [Flagellimonas sp. CMM7]